MQTKIVNIHAESLEMSVSDTIGRLDRLLSEFLLLTEWEDLDEVDAHTLKHHADDLIGVANKALETLRKRSHEITQDAVGGVIEDAVKATQNLKNFVENNPNPFNSRR